MSKEEKSQEMSVRVVQIKSVLFCDITDGQHECIKILENEQGFDASRNSISRHYLKLRIF